MGGALYGRILFFFLSRTDSWSSGLTDTDVAEVDAVTATVAEREGGRGTRCASRASGTPHTTEDISLLVTALILFTPFFKDNSVCGLLLYAVFELINR